MMSNTSTSILPVAIFAALALLASTSAEAQSQFLLWQNTANGNSTSNYSVAWQDAAQPRDTEVADDFDVVGSVERLVVTGHGCFQCVPPTVDGVWVRFWEWTAGGPGALLQEQFLAGDDPRFIYDAEVPDGLDITLPEPFAASGQHFVSVQMVFAETGFWDWWLSNQGQPRGVAIHYRDAAEGGTWGPHVDFLGHVTNSDVAFELYGQTDDPPPQVVAGCGPWRVVPAPAPEGSHHAILRDVVADADGEAWAVGEFSAEILGNVDTFTLAMHFDGQRWQIVDSPSPTPAQGLTYSGLGGVDVDDSGIVWAAGSTIRQSVEGWVGSHALVLRRSGDGWEELETPITEDCSGSFVRGVKAVGSDVWFVGDWCGGEVLGDPAIAQPAMVMRWNGSNLEIFPAPEAEGGAPAGVEAVDAVAADDVWAVGGGGDGDWVGYSYVIHWDGVTWNRVPFDLPQDTFGARLFSVDARAADDVWIGGFYQDASGIHSLLAHWDGVSLDRVDTPAGGAAFMDLGAGGLLASGGGFAHWDGTEWTSQPAVHGVSGASVGALAATGECQGWGVGRQNVAGDLLPLIVMLDAEAEGDTGTSDAIFSDGFETGDTSRWAISQ